MLGLAGPVCLHNFGDHAMLLNDILDILELFPTEEIVVFSQHPETTTTMLKPYLHDNSIRIVGGMRAKVSPGGLQRIYSAGQKLLGIPQLSRCLRAPHQYFENLSFEKLEPALSKLRVLILMGGGYFNEQWFRWRRKTLEYIMGLSVIAHRNGVLVGTLGNTIGPFDPDSAAEFRLFSPAVDRWGVRESNFSPQMLAGLGVPNDKINILPDDLMFPNSRLANYQTQLQDQTYAVMDCGMVEPRKIGRYLDTHLKIVEHLWNKYKIKTMYLPFNEGSDGVWQGTYLRARLRGKKYFVFRTQGFPIDISEYISLIKNARLVVSTHYHSAVLAVASRRMPICFVRNVAGSSHYYYTKYMGCLENFWRHSTYPVFTTETTFEQIASQIDYYIHKGGSIFDKNYFQVMKSRRMDYLRSLLS